MQHNQQPAEKRIVSSGLELAVNSIFHTIQGEGPFAGSPAVFIRLAGCNLQCPLCDTEYTSRETVHVLKIVSRVRSYKPKGFAQPNLVVITGGEPFRQSIGPLILALLHEGFLVQIETNGTIYQHGVPYTDPRLTIVCSPKAGKINADLMPHIRAFKYVANVESLEGSVDGLPSHALEHPNGKGLARPSANWQGDIYLQPVDEKDERRGGKNDKNLTAVVHSCQKYGHRLCLQIHKIIGVD